MKRFGKEIVAGACHGITVALAYFLVEFALLTLVPLITQPTTEVAAPFWHATNLLLIGYVVCGAILGVVAGAFLALPGPRQETSELRLLAATTFLPIVFASNLLAHPPLSGGGAISIAMATALMGALVASLRSAEWRDRLVFLTGPLAASALLFLPLWISQEWLPYRGGLFKLAVIFATSSGIMLVAFLLRKMPWPKRVSMPYYLALGVIALLSFAYAAALAINPRSPRLPARTVAAAKGRPNVVLIVMDTVRADHTSLYGYERDTTPYLRELAKEATLYTRTFAVSDFTLPTHASMFTGLYPRTHGAHYAPPKHPNGRPLSQRFTTAAEVLQANGYRTAAVVANFGYLAPRMGFGQGFELYDSRAPLYFESSEIPYLRRSVRQMLDRFVSTSEFFVSSRRAGEINHEAYQVLEQVQDDSPFFLFINYMDAHTPRVPPPPFDRQFPCSDSAFARLERDGKRGQATMLMSQVMNGKRDLSPEERTCLAGEYDGGIAYVDSQIRELVESLRVRGLYDNTLLIVTSDHGEALGRRNQIGHGGVSVYQNEIGIPLLVKYPGVTSGARVNAEASQVDLLPTVLEVASIAEPTGLQGISLRKLENDHSRFVVSVSYPEPFLSRLNRQYARVETAVMRDAVKLIDSSLGKRELFDLSSDANEERNLFGEDNRGQALSKMLDQWMLKVPAASLEDQGRIDSGTMERLKSLGYAQ